MRNGPRLTFTPIAVASPQDRASRRGNAPVPTPAAGALPRRGVVRRVLVNRILLLVGVAALGVAGCQTNSKPDPLDVGRAALRKHDFTAAGTAFDAYLAKDPNGPRAAEAYYLKGRAYEDAPSEDLGEAKGRLQQARLAYIDALKVGTDNRGLEGLIRASLADVAYWQEDYTTAAEQGRTAYPMLDDPTTRAWCLYRSGLSQQRLGKFEDGDRTLGLVVKYHPDTEPAARAKQRVGARAFSVRVPFTTTAAAAGATASLTRQGLPATTSTSEAAVLVGPFPTYAQASAARTRLTTQYPTATVVP